jgi:regulatory protein
MTVTAIEPYMRGKGRVAISLNDKFAFVLYKGELSGYGLDIGSLIDDKLYDRIMTETVFPRARKRGMNLLKTMDRTEADVRRRLSEGGYPPEAVDNAIEYLMSYHYIDDGRYAAEYIRCKVSSMSRKQIRAKLVEKGIDKATVEDAFSAYDEENQTDADDTEGELIRRLIKKRCPRGTKDLGYEEKQKLLAYLYGKGFSLSAVENILMDAHR